MSRVIRRFWVTFLPVDTRPNGGYLLPRSNEPFEKTGIICSCAFEHWTFKAMEKDCAEKASQNPCL
jgi:hypothetical protein